MAGFMIYLKPADKKRFFPLGGDGIVSKKIHAEIFTVNTPEDKAKLDREVESIRTLNPGTEAELRPVKGW